jgi:YGGT family
MTYDDRTVIRERQVAPPPADRPADQVNVNSNPGYVTTTATAGPLTVVRRVVGLLFGILEVLLALRVILLALGANSGNGLVDGIYNATEPFVAPFIGVFSINHVHPTGSSVIDVAAIVAIVAFALLAVLVDSILRIADRPAAA